MKILLLLSFVSLTLCSQPLGMSYDSCLSIVRVDSNYSKYKTAHIQNGYYIIQADNKNQDKIMTTNFFFDEEKKRCYQLIITIKPDAINKMIEENNKEYTKISDLKWKDYTSNTYIEIYKDETIWCVKLILF